LQASDDILGKVRIPLHAKGKAIMDQVPMALACNPVSPYSRR
jgi:hypothetical protein